MKKNIDAAIAKVTVYTDRALVTRQSTISLAGEESELILSNLPVTIFQDSVRVTGQGTSTVNILGVKVESVFTPEVAVESIAQLDQPNSNSPKSTSISRKPIIIAKTTAWLYRTIE